MENALIISFIILLILSLTILGIYNKIVKLKHKVNESASDIDIFLKQRFDLIPNLVETVKGYMKHEEGLLTKVTELRNTYNSSSDILTGEELNNNVNKILAIAESYPELKANESFNILQTKLIDIENKLEDTRIIFNNRVTKYNIKIKTVPSNIVASMFGFKEERLFQIEDNERENIGFKF